MKKKIKLLFACMIVVFVMFVGCSEKTSESEADYVVVDASDAGSVEELFSFVSINSNSLTGDLSAFDVEEGVYNIGRLENGFCILWRADDDNSGYDDGLFLYAETEINDSNMIKYAMKLDDSPISYDEYLKSYN